MVRIRPASFEAPPPAIAVDKVCHIVVKAREYDAKEAGTDPEPGSNASDDRMIDVLEESADDPVEEELTAFIDALSEDEQVELVALAWLGRGDGSLEEWHQLRHAARGAHNDRTAAYLLGIPLLADYLEEALSQFGLSCRDFESSHL